ncbi:MAG: DNA-directed RNA polymerase subunit alpha C-terminal domain-containing protein [Planctomycetota bacterium]|jgi:hypothetical protein
MPGKKTPNSAEAKEMLAMSQGLGLDDSLVQMLKARSRGTSLAEIGKKFKVSGSGVSQTLAEPFSRFLWLKANPLTPAASVTTSDSERALRRAVEALEKAGKRIKQTKEELERVIGSASKDAATGEESHKYPELPDKVRKALEKAQVNKKKVSELMRRTPEELRKFKDLGLNSVMEVRSFLTKRGLRFKGDKR